jgi:hypothetical protein
MGAPEPQPTDLVRVPVHDEEAAQCLAAIAASLVVLEGQTRALVPAGSGSGHWVPGDNKLHAAQLSGVLGSYWNRPLLQAVVSLYSGGTLIVGNHNIAAAGAPTQVSDGEILRVHAPAGGGVYIIPLLGLPPAAMGQAGQQFFYWTDSSGLVIDIQILHG